MGGLISSKDLQLKDIPSLNQDHCKIKSPERLEWLINKFSRGGVVHKLQVVMDYDLPITKQRSDDGREVLTSFDSLKACGSMNSSFKEEYDKLYSKYNPNTRNFDTSVPFEEKKEKMTEWWTKIGNLLVGFPIKQREIDEISNESKDHLRDRTHELFQTLECSSFGILCWVGKLCRYKGDLADGFEEPLIHSCNKNETALEGAEYYDLVHSRDHIIVMGDSIGDAGMADGLPNSKHVIEIGFLFGNVEENLPKFMDAFDIVLVDDQTMDLPRALIKIIENKKVG